ncbi:hypothetical protein E3N88_14426 [Mikania micrantha]|uniref:Uncharacterized protein n=1 Tax=Mikania micrantha TaxID=192012 RepID=A0A5N6P402_9ASTR|nr:hypothetical protein E3N88_14426 [Mikania micrantha]
MKQHLAGVKGNVASCVKVPGDVKLLIQGNLEKKVQRKKEKRSGIYFVKSVDASYIERMLRPSATSFEKIIQIVGPKTFDYMFPDNMANCKASEIDMQNHDGDDVEALPPEIKFSKFDYSVENYFKLMDKITMLSGESEFEYEQTEIQRLTSSVTFLSKWRDFIYQPRAIRFACEKETSKEKDVTTCINLPQFSSAAVPKDKSLGNKVTSQLSKDFVMNVGGPVWALDWCPRVHKKSTLDTNVEFIAVSAHPPESSYHKIGNPLTGRGLIQIWCLLNTSQGRQVEIPLVKVKSRKAFTNIDPTKPKRPRGRPRKPPINKMDSNDQLKQDLPVQSPESSNNLLQLVSIEEIDKTANSCKPQKPRKRPRKKSVKKSSNNFDGSNKNMQPVTEYTNNSPPSSPEPITVKFPDKSTETLSIDKFSLLTHEILAKEQVTKKKNQEKDADSPNLSQNCESPLDQDNVLPRLVMGLAHNGIVAWDVKWRPFDTHPISKHIMGYLAVLLGNGALEVWEVPLPHVTKAIFSSCQKKDNDPRFLKLKPVFLCSMLKSGDRQSIPLTLEWSASAPHDLILAGCHDGVVALWKFSASSSSKDTRPLLCFNADTVPIRTLKWAPLASDPESANTIVTAGHNGLKFWDLRDPFHPLWDIPSQKNINSLDWLPNPRCVLLSLDDGEIKIISLLTAACDVPVTGMPSDKKPQHGTYSYYCSSSSIWSVQASRSTGMVAYCCSDGKVVHFQLTTKAVEKDPHRNREPHYLCGSITEEDSCLTVLSPLPNIPIPMKISSTEWGDTPKTSRGVKSRSNQEKRAKEQISKCQTPPKQTSEGTQLETQTQTSRALVCIDNDTKMEDVENVKIEVFPPKSVAMHRATWNMNKGGERLVCYGGAAGILRCQEIM